jgi:DNA-binding transcriptional regulator YdaS (Cro superfamily)
MLQSAITSAMKIAPEDFAKLFGSPSALAKAIGENPSTVHCWKHRGVIPPNKVLAVSDVTGIPPHRIRSDIFAAPSARKHKRKEAGATA